MIIKSNNKNITKSADFKERSCSIDQEDMRYIASLLRNNYSNPLLATIREIIANALDVTKSKKVDIQLPTQIEPNFIVRDFGCGLSEEDMLGLYTKYGKSTKRESNESIGGFGIGRFAPLSYTDSFIVRSVHQGHKHSYIIRVDEQDDTIVSQIESQPTKEADGIYVQVGIKKDDIHEFFKIFKKTWWYRQDEIKLLNEDWGDVKLGKPQESNDVFDLYQNNSYWEDVSHFGSEPYVLMGGIPYKVNESDDWFMFKSGLVYKAEIGEFKLHHSRESLEYNPQVKQALKKASDKIFAKLNEELGSQMDKADTFYEASEIMHKAMETYRQRFGTKLSISSSKFKDVNGILFPKDWIKKETHITTRENGNLSFSHSRYSYNDNSPSDKVIYIVDDYPSPRSPKSRCMFLHDFEKENKIDRGFAKIVLINSEGMKADSIDGTYDTQALCVQRVKDCNHPNVKLLSECERIIAPQKARKKGVVKSLSAMDILKFDSSVRHEWANLDTYWGIEKDVDFDDDSKTYYYVNYYANKITFEPYKKHLGASGEVEINPYQFIRNYLENIPSFKENIWGVRKNLKSRIEKKDNWICLDDVYEDLVEQDEGVQNYVKWYEERELFQRYDSALMEDIAKFPKDNLNEILKNLLKSYDGWRLKQSKVYNQNYNHDYVMEKLKPQKLSGESLARKRAFDKAFPMAKYCLEGCNGDNATSISDVLAYIGE
jgi:hypothetical protein